MSASGIVAACDAWHVKMPSPGAYEPSSYMRGKSALVKAASLLEVGIDNVGGNSYPQLNDSLARLKQVLGQGALYRRRTAACWLSVD